MPVPGVPPLPIFDLPKSPLLPAPVLELPRAELPSYEVMVFPPSPAPPQSSVKSQTQKKTEETPEKPPQPKPPKIPISKEVTKIQIPVLDIEVPVPRAEIVSTAMTTSAVSVGAALAATSIFKRLVSAFKPVIKTAVKKVQKMRGKKVLSFGRQRLEQRRHKRQRKDFLA
jgi:hypothetical protein